MRQVVSYCTFGSEDGVEDMYVFIACAKGTYLRRVGRVFKCNEVKI